MKKLLSIILVIALTMTLFASCGETETALTATELLDLGEKYLLDLDYEQAIVYFNQVIEVEPRNSRAYMGAAEAYVGLGDAESAINLLKTALEVFSDDEEVTIEILEMLIEIEPDNAEWYLDLAQVYANTGNRSSAISVLRQGMDYVGSAKTQLYDKLIEIDSDTIQWYFELADVYEDLSNIPSAVDTLELGLNNFEDDDTKIDFSEELIEIDSTNIERYLSLAQLYVDINDLDSAISILCQGMDYVGDAKTQLYDKLIEIDSDTTQWYFELADVYEVLSNIPSAVDTLELGLNNFEDDATKIDFSEELIEIDETNAEWYLTIAYIYIAQSDTDAAIAILREGLEKASDTTEIEYLLNQLVPDISELKTTSAYSYYADGSICDHHVYVYDSDGNIAKETFEQNLPTGERLTGNATYDCDKTGTIVSSILTEVYYYTDGETTTVTSTSDYDSYGNVISQTSKGSNSNGLAYVGITTTYTYEYDSYGNIINSTVKTVSNDSAYIEVGTDTCEYDSHGNVINSTTSVVYYDGSTYTTASVYTYEYNESGDVISKTITTNGNSNTYNYEYEYEYDSNGIIQKCVVTMYIANTDYVLSVTTLERIN